MNIWLELKKHSKTIKRVLDGIEKEKSRFKLLGSKL